jgi:hypothetical protein
MKQTIAFPKIVLKVSKEMTETKEIKVKMVKMQFLLKKN